MALKQPSWAKSDGHKFPPPEKTEATEPAPAEATEPEKPAKGKK